MHSKCLSRYAAVAGACFALLANAAAEAKRVAFVVGISDYQISPPLANPGRDAAGVANALTVAGFEVVQSLDADLSSLTKSLEEFYAKAEGAEAAVFFYAGHGLQFNGINYLVPRDAELRSEARLKQEAIALQDIISAIEKRASVTLVFLDACRDNPLAVELQRKAAGGSRSAAVARGLAPLYLKNPDTLVVFAAESGKTAADGRGNNSPFTTALLKHLGEPGIEIELMMKRVSRDVVSATKGAQVPERFSRLTSEFVITPAPPQRLDWAPRINSVGVPAEPRKGERAIDVCAAANPPISCLWGKK